MSSDRLVERLAGFALCPVGVLDPSVLAAAKDRLVDSIGVALGAVGAEGIASARRYVSRSVGGCTVWGSSSTTSAQDAALVNGAAIRLLDFNDAYFSAIEGNHPSDMIAALVAVAEVEQSSGVALLEALVVGYEIVLELCDHLAVSKNGWDHVNLTALAACCGVGRLMHLSPRQLGNALSIMAVSHVAANQSRIGELTMWKGFAGADAVRHAVYACELASAGVAGPCSPFEGDAAFLVNVAHATPDEIVEAIDLPSRNGAPPCTRILDTHLKRWAVAHPLQSAVEAALSVRQCLRTGDEIRAVRVFSSARAISMMADREKWAAKTEETADHSLPYLVSALLLWGSVDRKIFDDRHRRDSALRAMLDGPLRVEEEPSFNENFGGTAFPTRIEVVTTAGTTHARESRHPPGHPTNPLSRSALVEKVRPMYSKLGEKACEELVDLLFRLETVTDIQEMTRYLAVDSLAEGPA